MGGAVLAGLTLDAAFPALDWPGRLCRPGSTSGGAGLPVPTGAVLALVAASRLRQERPAREEPGPASA